MYNMIYINVLHYSTTRGLKVKKQNVYINLKFMLQQTEIGRKIR